MAKTVLIVHEDAALVDQIKGQISAASPDMEVITALSGPRAMGIVGAQKPSVVLVDGELEGMDGYALTQQIKADPTGADTSVIILSLSPNEASALKARQVGAAAHLPAAGSVDAIVERVLALAGVADSGLSEPAPVATTAPVADTEGLADADPIPPSGLEAVQEAAAGAGEPEYGLPQPVRASAGAAEAAEPSSQYGVPQPAGNTSGAPLPQPVMASVPASIAEPAGPAPEGRVGAEPPKTTDVPHIDDLLRLMLDRGGSDLHITVGSPPGIRLRGEIHPIENTAPLVPRDTMEMILNLLSEEQRKRFETELELDFAYSIPGVSRFRANVFQQRSSMGAVFRVIPIQIPSLEDLGLPKVCRYLAERPRGLVLVTGPTGSGKSTTLAAMIDHINANRQLHIVTLEDPIEFMHKNKKAYVNQREIGEDTHSFASALKRVLRQDPDVILVGEMRDLETISAAITAAETGHLVLATLHTTGGPATIDRIIDVFPPHQQQQVRMQLSGSLEGVLSQVLLRSTDGRSRVMAMEIMLGIPAIQNLIREGKTHQMATIIQGGASLGMQTLDQHLKTLLQSGKVTFEEAVSKAMNPRELAQLVGRKI